MLSDSTTLLLIDPHQLFIDGLVSLLERKKEFEIIGAYTNPATGLHAYKKLQPQVTIISDCFPDMHTVTLIQEMKLFRKQAKVIVLAGKLQDFMVLESIKSGADGFIARSSGFHILEKALGKIINDESYYCDMVSQILAKSLLSGNENGSFRKNK
jgi:DNA-binding NarL/FixJ family response regulator